MSTKTKTSRTTARRRRDSRPDHPRASRAGVPMDARNPGTFVRDSIILMQRLSDPAFRLYCILRAHVWETDQERVVPITSAELERMMGRSRSSIYRYLVNLRDVGLIGLHEQRVWWVYQGTTSGRAERRTMNVYAVLDVPFPDYDGPRSISDVRELFRDGHGPRAGDRVRVVSSRSRERVIEHYNPYGPNELVDLDQAEPVDDTHPMPVDAPTSPALVDQADTTDEVDQADQTSPHADDVDTTDHIEHTTENTTENDVSPAQTDVSKMNSARVKNDTPYKKPLQYSGGSEGSARARAIEGEREPHVSAASWELVADLARSVLTRDQFLTREEYRGLALMCEHARTLVDANPLMTWDEYESWLRQGWLTDDGRQRFKSFFGTLAWRFKADQVNGWATSWVCERRGKQEADHTRGTHTGPRPKVHTCARHGEVPVDDGGRCVVCEVEKTTPDPVDVPELPQDWGQAPEPTEEEITRAWVEAGIIDPPEGSEEAVDDPGGGSLIRGRVKSAQAAWDALRDVLGDRLEPEAEWTPHHRAVKASKAEPVARSGL